MALTPTKKIWFNDKLVNWDDAKIHVLSHCLHYGTGIYEGMRCYKGAKVSAIFRCREHMTRFAQSAKIYDMPLKYSVSELVKAAVETVRVNELEECYVRPVAFYGYGSMGVNPSGSPFEVAIACWPWGAYLGEEGLKRGIRTTVSSWKRINPQSQPVFAKGNGNYLNSYLAKMEAVRRGFDEAILLNAQGEVAEGSGENIFVIKDRIISTPPLSSGVLSGITRDSVITLAKDAGLQVVEREILVEELFVADEIFFTGTAAEVTPIREVDGREIGSGGRGPLTEKLQKAYLEAVRGKNAKYSRWLEPV